MGKCSQFVCRSGCERGRDGERHRERKRERERDRHTETADNKMDPFQKALGKWFESLLSTMHGLDLFTAFLFVLLKKQSN